MAGKVVGLQTRLLAVFTAELGSVNVSEVCRELGVSRETFYKYRRRFAEEGPWGLVERSRRPLSSPNQVSAVVEDKIVKARKELEGDGKDYGAQAIVDRLVRDGHRDVPSVATTHRVLVRRGQVTPQPSKRPRSATKRFVWPFPNDAWQIDATHWVLADGAEAWVMDILDDHSRLVPAALACPGPTTQAAWETVTVAAERYGLPANVMCDNGSCFTGRFQSDGRQVRFERNLAAAGINQICSSPGHPQTCGKLERFHQTLKKWLGARPLAPTIEQLQTQLDEFLDYYNTDRPHRALSGAVPLEAWQATPRSTPGQPIGDPAHARLATVDRWGAIAYHGHLIGVGTEHAGRQVLLLADGPHVTVIGHQTIIRRLTIDPTRRYQPSGKPPGRRPKPTPPPH